MATICLNPSQINTCDSSDSLNTTAGLVQDISGIRNRLQQLISLSFTSWHFLFITFILSISKLCSATGLVDTAQAGATTQHPAPGFLTANLSGSALLEKLSSLRTNTWGPPTAVDKDKPSPTTSSPIMIDHRESSFAKGGLAGRHFMGIDFNFLNISGKIGTPLGIGKSHFWLEKMNLVFRK